MKKLKNYQTRTVAISHLPELQENIEKLKRQNLIDKHLAEVYLKFDYDLPESLPEAQYLIIVAVHQLITRASFIWRGKVYFGDVPPTYIGKVDDVRVKDALTKIVEPAGYKLIRAPLPVKTLAVRSGLAQYGRNNITYVPGYGSFHRLVAFITDGVFPKDSWGEPKAMKTCESCFICHDYCPTRCIPTDRFLLHAENCLTWHNEREAPLADWIKPGWHNALIGCLRCQLVCPVNKNQLDKVVNGPEFSEAETELLLSRPAKDNVPEATRKKVEATGIEYSYEVLGRNLEVLLKSRSVN